MQARKIHEIGLTFEQIIKKDKDFGSLLLKIKAAYDAYLEKQIRTDSASDSKDEKEVMTAEL